MFQSLEQRRLLSTLSITGTSGPDLLKVQELTTSSTGSTLNVMNVGTTTITVKVDSTSVTLKAGKSIANTAIKSGSKITAISSVDLQGGNDSFAPVAALSVPLTSLLGGDGNDTLTGGSKADLIMAGTGNDSVFGKDGNDTIHGSDGNDSLDGGTGDDSVTGENGNDSVFGNDGNDTLDGGDGTDDLRGGIGNDVTDWSTRTAAVTVQISDTLKSGGTSGGLTDSVHTDIEVVWGSPYADLIIGATTNATLRGNAGNDTIRGGTGSDSLDGGAGNDDLRGLAGNDTIQGQDGNDTLDGGDGTDDLHGGSGTDVTDWSNRTAAVTVQLSDSAKSGGTAGGLTDSVHADIEVVWGSPFNDRIVGSSMANTLFGGGGNDTLIGGSGDDLLRDDLSATGSVPSTYGNDSLEGDDGNDTLIASAGNDTMAGGAGNDTYAFDVLAHLPSSKATDTIYESSGGGTDVLNLYDSATGGPNADTTINSIGALVHLDQPTAIATQAGLRTVKTDSGPSGVPEVVIGTAGDDTMFGSANADTLIGVDGTDQIDGNAGNDVIYSYAFIDGNLNDRDTDNNSDANGDTLIGNSGDDSVYGSNGDDSISGGAGNDSLVGDDGNGADVNQFADDTLDGGDGDDFLTISGGTALGGPGNDRFVNQNNTPDFIDGGDGFDISEGDGGKDFVVNSEIQDDVVASGTDTGDGGTGDAVNAPALAPAATPATVTAAIDSKKILRINGTANADSITVTQVGTTLTVQAAGKTIGTFSTTNIVGAGKLAISVQGGGGSDVIAMQSGSGLHPVQLITRIQGGDGNDSILGGALNDLLEGDAGNDTVNGEAGNDILTGDYLVIFGAAIPAAAKTADGNDVIIGGPGDSDEVTYTYRTKSVAINISGTNATSGQAGETDKISGVEILIGGQANDTLTGSSATDVFFGGPGNDSMTGGAGNDLFSGQGGIDTINPDSGSDFINSGRNEKDTLIATYTGRGTANHFASNNGIVTNSKGTILFGSFGLDYFSLSKNNFQSF